MEGIEKRLDEREQLHRILTQKCQRYSEMVRNGASYELLKRQMADMKSCVDQMALLNLDLADYDERERMHGNDNG